MCLLTFAILDVDIYHDGPALCNSCGEGSMLGGEEQINEDAADLDSVRRNMHPMCGVDLTFNARELDNGPSRNRQKRTGT